MNLSEINWDFNGAGAWPKPIKIATAILVFLIIIGLGYYQFTSEKKAELEVEQQNVKPSLETDIEGEAVNDETFSVEDDSDKETSDIPNKLPSAYEAATKRADEKAESIATEGALTSSEEDIVTTPETVPKTIQEETARSTEQMIDSKDINVYAKFAEQFNIDATSLVDIEGFK